MTKLPFQQLSPNAAQADTFEEFPTSFMIVGKTSDDNTISIFTKDGIIVHKEEVVLITCKGAPILTGKRDERGCYHIPLVHQQGQYQPRKPSKKAKKQLCEANSVYDLSSTEQAIECIPRWLPSQDNLVESKPSRQLHEMVANHQAQC